MTMIFPQTVIAVIWDFDKTLIPTYMQDPLFRRFGVDGDAFWEEVKAMADFYRAHGSGRVAEDVLYLNHILAYVREGKFKGLSNALLRELGGEITFYPGAADLLKSLTEMVDKNPKYSLVGLTLEHYVVSTGLRAMIDGSAIRPFVADVWACEFIEATHPAGNPKVVQPALIPNEIVHVGYAIDNTTKTRALFEINKGTNKESAIGVNDSVPHEFRRVPFKNMIYIADGPSDTPAFSVVRGQGGRTFGVYEPKNEDQFEQVSRLQRDGRVDMFAEANYRIGSTAAMWLQSEVRRIADRIVEDRQIALRRIVSPAATHLVGVSRRSLVEDKPGVDDVVEEARSLATAITDDEHRDDRASTLRAQYAAASDEPLELKVQDVPAIEDKPARRPTRRK